MFVDFDGTLAPIVEEPDAARPHHEAVGVLRDLAARWGVVAVVSGRPAGFLARHLQGAGATRLLGLYGMERGRAGSADIETDPDAEAWRPPVGRAADEAEMELGREPVERKGLTVTLHYRRFPERAEAVEAAARALAARHGLEVHSGKMSVELRPPVRVDKGTVVDQMAAGLAAVVFAGDDAGDLPAFAALGRLASGGTATLAVASGGTETPPEVTAAADVVVDGPDGILAVLRRLV